MFVDPTVDYGACLFGIWDDKAKSWAWDSTSPAGDQPSPDGVYDGPGQTLQVKVIDLTIGVMASGPEN
jgi:hypothetical protein